MIFPERPLGYVKQGLEEMGMSISHVTEDLIFPDNSACLFQFGSESYELLVYLHRNCKGEDAEILKRNIINSLAGKIGFSLEFTGMFTMEQAGEDEVKLTFILNNQTEKVLM